MKTIKLILICSLLVGMAGLLAPIPAHAADTTSYYWRLTPLSGDCRRVLGAPLLYIEFSFNADYNLPATGATISTEEVWNGFTTTSGPTAYSGSGSLFLQFQQTFSGFPVTYTSRDTLIIDGVTVALTEMTATCSNTGPVQFTVTETRYDNNVTPVPTPVVTTYVPGPDMVLIPSTAAVGLFLVDTPAYFAPKLDAVMTIQMAAGKTIWVYGLDASGAFYKVMLAGKFFWVPTKTLGPNPDKVWNNHPLPTNVVE